MPVSLHLLSIPPLGLWLLCSLVTSQEICNSSGTLPAPWLFLNRLSARQGDTAVLSCLVPCGSPVTRIVFCKDGKEISVQPKEGNNRIYDLPYTVSRESAGAFSCRYLHKDDNNQESNSLPSDPRHLQVAADGDGCGEEASPQEPAIPLWVWILRLSLVLLLLASAPIVTCILRERAIALHSPKGCGWNGSKEEEGEEAIGSGGSPCPGLAGGLTGVTERSVDYSTMQKHAHGAQGN